MANNYVQMSEAITDITKPEADWLQKVLGLDIEQEEGRRALEAELHLDLDSAVLDDWPGFVADLRRGDGCDTVLYIYGEEHVNLNAVEILVREFICRFRPDYIFTCTTAETCSKPRVGEFGGGWMVVSANGTLGGNTWDAAEAAVKQLRQKG